jgi:tRNA pseudouridine13 synthase
MYTLKQTPEDFVVEEIIELKLDDGDYAYFWLRKKGYTTVRALEKVSGFLKCRLRDIGFAGNKDKQAVTKQAISIKDSGRRIGGSRFDNFNSDQLSLEYIGRGNKPISLGDLSGNKFSIVLRECSKEPAAVSSFVNYFDEQRFSETNKEVGKAILRGDFEKACSLIDAEEVQAYLSQNPTDYVGAMKTLPLKIRMIHVHSYQSWLWNETVARYLRAVCETVVDLEYSLGRLVFPDVSVPSVSIPIVSVPIIGFGTEFTDEKIKKIVDGIMEKEGISSRDFVIRSMPELSAEGGMRDVFVDVKDISIEKISDGSYRLKFVLPKGSYATMVVKQMMI